jgi:ATP-dependent protease ClpP protease subunit
MKIWKVAIVFFVIGILLSFSRMSQTATDGTIVLTKKNHVLFSGEVTDSSVSKAQVELAKISADLSSDDVIYLVIDSPGGSVPAGNRFIDFAGSLPQKVKPICLFCASMGYHMFQSLDERIVYSSSELMSHRVRIGGLAGQVPGEAVSRLNDIIATSQRMDEKVAKRIGISVEAYQKSIYDELWLNGTDAVKLKHADRVAKIRCDRALAVGTRKETFNTLFGPVEVTTSTCPLISGFLALDLKRGNTFRSNQEAIDEVRRVKRIITTKY